MFWLNKLPNESFVRRNEGIMPWKRAPKHPVKLVKIRFENLSLDGRVTSVLESRKGVFKVITRCLKG